MTKIKVNRIISFSSEDAAYVASNILSNDTVNKWKCQTVGEKAATVILQLEEETCISAIDVGNENSAFVEVLVNRSSAGSDYKVLVIMSSLMSPADSKENTNVNKMRTFSYTDLRSPERDQKWDRVKIVCTQPFNRRVQYGLSFITLHSDTNRLPGSSSPAKIGNFVLRPKSPGSLSVGSLFARRKEQLQATKSQKPETNDVILTPRTSDTNKPTNRNDLYKEDNESLNLKIDRLIEQNHKERRLLKDVPMKDIQPKPSTSKKLKDRQTVKGQSESSTSGASVQNKKRKLSTTNTQQQRAKPNRLTKPFGELLSGVTFVISGIQNPERTAIRNQALAMGAKYKSDWDNSCTHLVCAFTNTPKFSQVKGKGKIVNKVWINNCHTQRKRLPWRRYALDPSDKTGNESEDEIWEKKDEEVQDNRVLETEDTDTEDEIERIQASKKITNPTISKYNAETDEEIEQSNNTDSSHCHNLPDLLAGKVLYIDKQFSESTSTLLIRYITAYNGLLVSDMSDVVDYAVASPVSSDALKVLCPEVKVVSPDWIWECHNTKRLVSDYSYLL